MAAMGRDMEFLDLDDDKFAIERELRGAGVVAGVDEAGRGPLAGPVVAAAVILPWENAPIPKVDDSKKLSGRRRRELRDAIVAVPGILYSIVAIDAAVIDEMNILRATHHAMAQCLEQLPMAVFAIIDGLPVKGLPIPSRAVVRGDSKSASIAAASILAKVSRDEMMDEFAGLYPGYGFEKHKGYGTKAHLEALRELGPCAIHRRSFAPVRDIANPPELIQDDFFQP